MLSKEFLLELNDTPYSVIYNDYQQFRIGSKIKNGFVAKFVTDNGHRYVVTAVQIGKTKKEREQNESSLKGGIWEIDFGLLEGGWNEFEKSKEDITGTGDQFRVFATVFSVIDRMIKKYKPLIIVVKSKMSQGNRSRLYKRMAKQYAEEKGYKLANTKLINGGKIQRLEFRRL